MSETKLCMITEHSPFMMSFVFLTRQGRAVVVDGGRPEDIPYLFEIVGTRPVAAWILTHPHIDHISGFTDLVARGGRSGQIGTVYYDFPSLEFARRCDGEDAKALEDFLAVEPLIRSRAVRPLPGSAARVDELTIRFLYCGGEKHERPKPHLAVNESSLAFRVTAPGLRSVLFLGDLGPEGGRDLLRECPECLPSDIVQMSHHGHAGVTEAVYAAVAPQACMWCAPDWLWDEADVEFEPELWGTRHTRAWMNKLGVREHYVTMNGNQWIPLEKGERPSEDGA